MWLAAFAMQMCNFMNITSKELTCSTPSMCASISWMTLASRSASSAERRPLLIFSASRLMSLWASSRYAWSGWSSAVCLRRSYKSKTWTIHKTVAEHEGSWCSFTWGSNTADLNQQLVSRDPLDRFDHQVSQRLFLLVLTHALLSNGSREKDVSRSKIKRLHLMRKQVTLWQVWLTAVHVSTTRGQNGFVQPSFARSWASLTWGL